jgi:hypothetical protein
MDASNGNPPAALQQEAEHIVLLFGVFEPLPSFKK